MTEEFPFILILHVLTFVAFCPAIISTHQHPEIIAYNEKRRKNMFHFEPEMVIKIIRIMFERVPLLLKILCGILFVYTFFNFIFFSISSEGINMTAGFSSNWMVFFLVSGSILYPFRKEDKPDSESNEHRNLDE